MDDVLDFLRQCDELGVHVWLDGGWGVDALLHRQTRPHGDLDIAIARRDAEVLVPRLRAQGYDDVARGDTSPWNFVLGRGEIEIDLHVIDIDGDGNGHLGPKDVYPAESLTGRGRVGDREVDCISAEWMVRFHTGYDVDEDDWADVSALCAEFGIAVPPAYASFADRAASQRRPST